MHLVVVEVFTAADARGAKLIGAQGFSDAVAHLFDKVMVVGKSSEGCGRLCYFGSVDNALKVFAANSLEDIVHKISGAENAALVDRYVLWFENERRGVHAG